MVKTATANGMKKGAWSKEEDDMLRTYVLKYGHWNWRELPRFAGLSRCGKSCRLRWVNYLRPNVKRGSYTLEEDELIMKLYKEHGTKWSLMAKNLPGRTDNEIKNHWHTKLKKLVVEKPPSTKASENEDSNTTKEKQCMPVRSSANNIVCHQTLESSAFYPEASSSELSSYSIKCERSPVSENNMKEDASLKIVYPDFWREPFVPDNASESPGNLSSWMEGEFSEFPYEDYAYLQFDLQQLYDNY